MPVFARWLLAPTIVGAFVNSRLWTLRHAAPVRVDERVWIGRTPTTRDVRRHGFTALVDLTAEMPRWAAADASLAYAAVPQLDLVVPSCAQLAAAVEAIERLHAQGRDVLVHCALGYGRSVLCAAAWLAARRGLSDARDALAAVREVRARAVWSDDAVAVLQDWLDRRAAARMSGASSAPFGSPPHAACSTRARGRSRPRWRRPARADGSHRAGRRRASRAVLAVISAGSAIAALWYAVRIEIDRRLFAALAPRRRTTATTSSATRSPRSIAHWPTSAGSIHAAPRAGSTRACAARSGMPGRHARRDRAMGRGGGRDRGAGGPLTAISVH
jgi:predicted protein tyrosine phosphatase